MLIDENEPDERGVWESVSWGMRVRQLIDFPWDAAQKELELGDFVEEDGAREVSLRDAIGSKRKDIVDLLGVLDLFGGALELEDSKREDAPLVASYQRSEREGYEHVLITTHARLKVVASELRAVVAAYGTHLKIDCVVFLGLQAPNLSPSRLNGSKELKEFKDKGRLPKRYLQTDDLLVSAERTALSNGGLGTVVEGGREILLGKPNGTRKRSLLVGNGIIRLENPHLSWTGVLETLAKNNSVSRSTSAVISPTASKIVANGSIPSPLKFEYLADHATPPKSGRNVFSHLKSEIAQMMAVGKGGMCLPPVDIRRLLCNLSMDYILTSNYDLVLEKCFHEVGLTFNDRKYLLNPTARVSTASMCALLYHIHGILKTGHEETICLGYEHYMGYVQALRSRLIKKSRTGSEVAWRVAHLLLGTAGRYGTWEELFFSSDVAIVGLGLDYEEADLWELLTLRAAVLFTSSTLRASKYDAQIYTNKITYYDVEVVKTKESNTKLPCIDDHYWGGQIDKDGKRRLLKELGVTVRIVHAGGYAEGYITILKELI